MNSYLLTSLLFISLSLGGSIVYVPINTDNNGAGLVMYQPDNYNSSGNGTIPLLICLHGAGNVGDGSRSALDKPMTEGLGQIVRDGAWPTTYPFLILFPQTSQNWNWWSVNPVMNYVYAKLPRVDQTRIYLTGLSEGGTGTLGFPANSLADANKIAAAVPVCTGYWATSSAINILASSNIPLWFFHNQGDPVLQIGFMTSWYPINDTGINPKAKFTIYPQNHHNAWDATYNVVNNTNDIYTWMLQYTNVRGSTTDTPPSTTNTPSSTTDTPPSTSTDTPPSTSTDTPPSTSTDTPPSTSTDTPPSTSTNSQATNTTPSGSSSSSDATLATNTQTDYSIKALVYVLYILIVVIGI